MKKSLVIIILLLLCTTFVYGDESEEIDLTNGNFFKGISINTTTPAYLPAQTINFNTFTFNGLINADIDSSTIQLYTLNGDNPLLKIVRHKSYMNGVFIDYQYVDGFTPIHNEYYKFKFKHKKSDDWMVYYVQATVNPIFTVTEDLTNSKHQAIYVHTDNMSNFLSSEFVDSFYLEDEYGKKIADGGLKSIDGKRCLVFDLSVLPKNGRRYYVKTTDTRIIIVYSDFLDRNYLVVDDEPRFISFNNELFDYSRDHNDYYILEYNGVNINPDSFTKIYFEAVNFTGPNIVKSDVLTSNQVDITYEMLETGEELLKLKIDKNYIIPESYSINILKNGREYDTFQFFIADNIENYSNYYQGAPNKNIVNLDQQNASASLYGSDFGVRGQFNKGQSIDLNLQLYKQVHDYYSVYQEEIMSPIFLDTNLRSYKIVSEILNLKQRNYMKDGELEVFIDLDSSSISNPGKYIFYQYDYEKKMWNALETGIDKKDNVLYAPINTLGQFVVVNYRKSFYDIKKHWAKDFIEDMASNGRVSGENNDFNPDRFISNAEFVTMLIKNLELEEETVILPYEDLKNNHWSYKFVMTAYANGLINDIVLFNPDKSISRVEMATMLAKVYSLTYQFGDINYELTFEDCDILDAETLNYIKVTKCLGIINGRSDEVFAPMDLATRAEAVVMISKLLSRLNK